MAPPPPVRMQPWLGFQSPRGVLSPLFCIHVYYAGSRRRLVLELGWVVEFEFLAHPISDKGEGGVYPRDLWQSPSQCAVLSMKLPLVNSNFNSPASTTTFEGAEEKEGGTRNKNTPTYAGGIRKGGGRKKDSRSALAFYGLSFQYANERNGRKRKKGL